jgi:hypothetical protein
MTTIKKTFKIAVNSVGRVPPEAPLHDFSEVLSFKNKKGEGYVSQRTTDLPLIHGMEPVYHVTRGFTRNDKKKKE